MAQARIVRLTAIALVVVLMSCGLISSNAQAADGMKMSGWLPYWLMNTSTTSAVDNADLFTDVSPFWSDAQVDNSLASTVAVTNTWMSWGTRSGVRDALQQKGIKVLPSITDGTATGHLSGVMKDATKRGAFVNQISNAVTSGGYDGIDLDFEKFAFNDGQSSWATTKPAWVTFISELGTALHANGKLLAVSVPPMYSDTSGYWVYAFRDIAAHVDKLRIMAYDYAYSSPGPIGGPLSWVRSVLSYAVSAVPASKVYLGTPTYGRDWVVSTSGTGCPSLSTRTYNTSEITFTDDWIRSSASMERNRTYTETYNAGLCTVSRSAWMPDAQTTLARWNLAQEYGVAGLAQWMIGTEQAGQWDLLRTPASPTPTPTPVDPPTAAPTPPPVLTTPPQRQPVAKAEIWVVKKSKKTVTLSGKLPKAGVRTVFIYRKINGKFKKVATVKTSKSGRFTIRLTALGKTFSFKVTSKLGSSGVLLVRR